MKSFLVGLGIGVGLGVLFAPARGQTRDSLDSESDLIGDDLICELPARKHEARSILAAVHEPITSR